MKKQRIINMILLAVIICLTVSLLVVYLKHQQQKVTSETVSTPQPTPTPTVIVQEIETIVEVAAEITEDEIGSCLKDMGRLATAEYVFTGIASATKPPQSVLGLELGFTAAAYFASYDGTATAGIDFGEISVKKDDETKIITVYLPAAEIQSVQIDLESFQLITEQSSIFAHITPEEFNTSQVALEETAKEKALSLGLLEIAEENAKTILKNLVLSLVGYDYSVIFSTAD